jgi:hypothetical protein
VADRLDALVELARRCAAIRASSAASEVRWKSGSLRVRARLELVHPDESPVVVLEHAGRLYLDPALTDGLRAEPLEVTDGLADFVAQCYMRERRTFEYWYAPEPLALTLEPLRRAGDCVWHRVAFAGEVELDPLTLRHGTPMRHGTWDVRIEGTAFGMGRTTRLVVPGAVRRGGRCLPAILGTPPIAVGPYAGVVSNWPSKSSSPMSCSRVGSAGAVLDARVRRGRLSVTVPLRSAAAPHQVSVELALTGDHGHHILPASAEFGATGATLLADAVPAAGPDRLRRGRYSVAVRTRDPQQQAAIPFADATVRFGRVVSVTPYHAPGSRRLRRVVAAMPPRAARLATSAARRGRAWLTPCAAVLIEPTAYMRRLLE